MKKQLLISCLALLGCCVMAQAQSTPDVLCGEFSISGYGQKVVFSKGNLQCVDGNWQLAEHQYDYFGDSQSPGQDMFAYNAYCLPDNDNSWFVLSHKEWTYLLKTRIVNNTLSDGAHFTMATLGDTYKGVILFPDDYMHPEGTDFVAGTFDGPSDFTATVSLDGWALMESAGCVFLPAAGYHSVDDYWALVGEAAIYSSTTITPSDSHHFYTPVFRTNVVKLGDDGWCHINSLTSVRLVKTTESGLPKDQDGYYLISSLSDWQFFSNIVKDIPNANARMTADIDLGDDQTKIGTESVSYQGVFDGQGHTLTLAYSVASYSDYNAPFVKIKDATIQNLHISGSITTKGIHPASIASYASGICRVSNCWSDVAITSNHNDYVDCGSFIGRVNSGGTLYMDDCVFTGSIVYGNSKAFSGSGLVGWAQMNAKVQVQDCLFAPSDLLVRGKEGRPEVTGMFVGCVVGNENNVSITNSYYNSVADASVLLPQEGGVFASDEDLSDGTTATALQNGREAEIWVQDTQAGLPMLKLFANVQGDDVATGLGAAQDDKGEMTNHNSWYSPDGRRLNGMPSVKGLYIVGGKKVIVR